MDPIIRVRHTLRYRRVTVARVESLTPAMRRVVLTSDDLKDFHSPSFDDHVKVFFPDESGELPTPVVRETGTDFSDAPNPPAARDFTPRRFDAARRELTLDIGVHSDGPAARWARVATVGSILGIGGPRGSAIVSDAFQWNLLVGDDTALPAIARRLEELPPAVDVVAIIEVDDESCEVELAARRGAHVLWLHRHGGTTGQIDDAVAAATFPAGDGFAWVAGESSVARRIRRLLIDRRRLDPTRIKAAAYWTRGQMTKHEVIAN